jgi:hypothetical protein
MTVPFKYRSRPGSVLLPVRGKYIGISDVVAAMFAIEDDVRSARYRIRDEANMITWVYDRLLGFSVNK